MRGKTRPGAVDLKCSHCHVYILKDLKYEGQRGTHVICNNERERLLLIMETKSWNVEE